MKQSVTTYSCDNCGAILSREGRPNIQIPHLSLRFIGTNGWVEPVNADGPNPEWTYTKTIPSGFHHFCGHVCLHQWFRVQMEPEDDDVEKGES